MAVTETPPLKQQILHEYRNLSNVSVVKAHYLAEEFDTLSELQSARKDDLMQARSIGEATAEAIIKFGGR